MFAQLQWLCVGVSNALVPAPCLFSPSFSVWFLFVQQFVASFVLCLSFGENVWRFPCDWQRGGQEVEVRRLPEEVSRLLLLSRLHGWASLVFCGWLYFLLLFQEGRGRSCLVIDAVHLSWLCPEIQPVKIPSLATPSLLTVIVLCLWCVCHIHPLTHCSHCLHYWPAHNLFASNICNLDVKYYWRTTYVWSPSFEQGCDPAVTVVSTCSHVNNLLPVFRLWALWLTAEEAKRIHALTSFKVNSSNLVSRLRRKQLNSLCQTLLTHNLR